MTPCNYYIKKQLRFLIITKIFIIIVFYKKIEYIYTIVSIINRYQIAKMSISESDASAQLAFISEKYGLDFDGKTCHFAYARTVLDKMQVPTSRLLEYIVVLPNGNLAKKDVALITRNVDSNARSEFCFVGIALQYVSPSTNVNEAINTLEKSQLVADLRQAMTDGKFAPLLNPPSSK
jgi:hypothetical protein